MGLWGLIRLILIALAVWWLYKAVRRLLGAERPRPVPHRPPADGEVLDVMVQDPQCGTYLPRQEAIKAVIRGEQHYFCSRECRDDFKAGVPPTDPELRQKAQRQ